MVGFRAGLKKLREVVGRKVENGLDEVGCRNFKRTQNLADEYT